MRIISPIRDYYDCVQSQGQDQSLIYLRTPKEVVLDRKTSPFPFTDIIRQRWGDDIIFDCNIVGFCGRIVPVLSVHNPRKTEIKPAFCYTLGDVDDFVEANFKKLMVERYYALERRAYWSEMWRYTTHRKLAEFFNEADRQQANFAHLFQESRCPVFVYRESRAGHVITYNACLKDVQFVRRVDPYTAFQEISMFLGNMASPEKPIPKIDDKTMAEAKGFDKWSFRKEPRKK